MLGILVSAIRFLTSGQEVTWALKSESGSERHADMLLDLLPYIGRLDF